MTSTLEPTTTALPPLKLGALAVDPAVVLAPMAGITNPAFRTLCREFGAGLSFLTVFVLVIGGIWGAIKIGLTN